MLRKIIRNEQGFVLIVSLLMLVILMVIGIAATNTTTIELQISGNDKATKQTFYQAEGGTQVGVVLVEDAYIRGGYPSNDWSEGAALVNNKDFYLNDYTAPAPNWNTPDVTMQQTSLIYRSAMKIAPGSAIQMAAGYEGQGKAAGRGGAIRTYDIWARHAGEANSEATIVIKWDLIPQI